MKKSLFVFAALAAFVGCQKIEAPVADSSADSQDLKIVVASAGVEATKVHFGTLSESTYPMIWDAQDSAALFEFIDTVDTQEVLSSNSVKVSDNRMDFTFGLKARTDVGNYVYVAVTPANAKINGNGYRKGRKGEFSYALVTSSQTPLANGPDPTTNILAAKYVAGEAQPSTIPFTFKHVVSFGKMTVKNFPALAADETVSKITITAPSSKTMSGRYFEDIYTGVRTKYSMGSCKNYIDILPTNITFNTTGFDIWFTTFPISLAQSDTLLVTVSTNKQIFNIKKELAKALNFEAGKVSAFTLDYSKRIPEEKPKAGEITFAFKSLASAAEKWPTATGGAWTSFDNCDSGLKEDNGGTATENSHRRMTADLTVDKTKYTFILADCDNAGSHAIYWNVGSGIQANAQRYLGLPVISGKRITKIVYAQQASTKAATWRYVGVTEEITAARTTLTSGTFVEGGAFADNSTGAGKQYTYTIVNTLDSTKSTGKQLYLTTFKNTSIFGDITVTYEDVKPE